MPADTVVRGAVSRTVELYLSEVGGDLPEFWVHLGMAVLLGVGEKYPERFRN